MVRYHVSFFVLYSPDDTLYITSLLFPTFRIFSIWAQVINFKSSIVARITANNNSSNNKIFALHRWDELGGYDIPSSLRFILSKTGFKKLSYIGHSLGTGIFFIAMIRHPELNQHIHKMIALAPITSKYNLRSPFRFVAPIIQPLAV